MNKFKFLKGIIKLISRTPMGLIPYPDTVNTPTLRRIFRHGWRACERDDQIYNCPYTEEANIRTWEYGYTECYNARPRENESTYDYYGRTGANLPIQDVYNQGYESARRGYPINNYPLYLNEAQRVIFYQGWDDFMNNH